MHICLLRYCSSENLSTIKTAIGDNDVINEMYNYTILISTIAYYA